MTTKNKKIHGNTGKKFSKEKYPNFGTRNKKFPRDKYPNFGGRGSTPNKETIKKTIESRKRNGWYKNLEEAKKNISLSKIGKKYPKDKYPNYGWRGLNKYLVLPKKNSSIEVKIQNFLTLLKIDFLTHKYMKIKNGYQCDILIPKQRGIKQKIIIECDGDYWHMNPKQFKPNDTIFKDGMKAKEKWNIDNNRTKQLIEKGFKVIRLWENKIKTLSIEEFKDILNNEIRKQ